MNKPPVNISVVEHPTAPTLGAVVGYSETEKQIYFFISFFFITFQARIHVGGVSP